MLSKYLDILAFAPLTTSFVTIAVVIFGGSLLFSLIFEIFSHVQNYWDRYESVNKNSFNEFLGKLLLTIGIYDCREFKSMYGYWVGVRSRDVVVRNDDHTKSSYDKPKKYYLYANMGHGGKYFHVREDGRSYGAFADQGFDDYSELSHLKQRYSLIAPARDFMILAIFGVVVAIVLDFLIAKLMLPTIIFFSIAAAIYLLLKGGRALTDMKKDVAAKKAKEVKND